MHIELKVYTAHCTKLCSAYVSVSVMVIIVWKGDVSTVP